jgi:beta-glucosidase
VPRHVVSIHEGLQAEAKERFTLDYAEAVRITESRIWAQDEVKLVDRPSTPS